MLQSVGIRLDTEGGGDVMYILINVDPVYCSLLIDVISMFVVGATATYELDALDARGKVSVPVDVPK